MGNGWKKRTGGWGFIEADRQGNHPCLAAVVSKEGGGSSLGIFERMVVPYR